MISNARNALNVPKTAGQRIYMEMDGQYRLLTMPSMFEIGFNYARWIYKTASDTIIVTNYTGAHTTEVSMNVRSTSGTAYRYLVTNQMTMNVNEYEYPLHMAQDGDTLIFKADPQAISAGTYPRSAIPHVGGRRSCECRRRNVAGKWYPQWFRITGYA